MKKDLKHINRDIGNCPAEFAHLFEFESLREKLIHKSHMVSLRILSEIEEICIKRNITHKQLAKEIEISESYLSQLFCGDKQINTMFIAKIEEAFDLTLSSKLIPNNQRIYTRIYTDAEVEVIRKTSYDKGCADMKLFINTRDNQEFEDDL